MTIADWESIVKTMSNTELESVWDALTYLKGWTPFRKSFEGFGTFTILTIIEAEQARR